MADIFRHALTPSHPAPVHRDRPPPSQPLDARPPSVPSATSSSRLRRAPSCHTPSSNTYASPQPPSKCTPPCWEPVLPSTRISVPKGTSSVPTLRGCKAGPDDTLIPPLPRLARVASRAPQQRRLRIAPSSARQSLGLSVGSLQLTRLFAQPLPQVRDASYHCSRGFLSLVPHWSILLTTDTVSHTPHRQALQMNPIFLHFVHILMHPRYIHHQA